MLTKLAGMALLAIVLNPGGEIHHSPAEGPTDQARIEERDNEWPISYNRFGDHAAN